MLRVLVIAGLLASIGASAIDQSPSGMLVPAPAMRMARAAHTATALRDGRVLVAGGFTAAADPTSGAELFVPGAGRFAPLPPMRVLRHSHSATRLANGMVLLAGGFAAGNQPTARAELFDPIANRFVETGAMTELRSGHVAMLLADGRVLITGGVGPDWKFLATAELYDPATGRFTATGAMSVARESHAAVLLSDGSVFIVGGHRDRREQIKIYKTSERYDPRTGRFRLDGEMRVARHKHDAILLRDGRVLITGGSDERDGGGVFSSTEVYDPRTRRFSDGPTLVRGRYKHQGTGLLRPDGSVLIAGGAPVAEVIDASATRSTVVPGAVTMAGQFSAVAPLPDGGALITGGYGNGTGPRGSTWRIRP